MKKQNNFETFGRVGTAKFKKRINCKKCGERINVDTFNQLLCKKCGFRGKELKDKPKEEINENNGGHINGNKERNKS